MAAKYFFKTKKTPYKIIRSFLLCHEYKIKINFFYEQALLHL